MNNRIGVLLIGKTETWLQNNWQEYKLWTNIEYSWMIWWAIELDTWETKLDTATHVMHLNLNRKEESTMNDWNTKGEDYPEIVSV